MQVRNHCLLTRGIHIHIHICIKSMNCTKDGSKICCSKICCSKICCSKICSLVCSLIWSFRAMDSISPKKKYGFIQVRHEPRNGIQITKKTSHGFLSYPIYKWVKYFKVTFYINHDANFTWFLKLSYLQMGEICIHLFERIHCRPRFSLALCAVLS